MRLCDLASVLSEPRSGLLSSVARFHIQELVPRIGSLLSGAQEYRYLQESIEAFPDSKAFSTLMGSSGLEVVEVRPLTFGVCTLFVARRGESLS